MACFIVPAAEAVITTVAAKIAEKKEKEQEQANEGTAETAVEKTSAIPFSTKLKWLRNLLWGGVVLLAFEHIWHGEVVPYFPFLTAASDPGSAAEMLHEMATVGTAMALFVTAVWLVMVAVSSAIEKRREKPSAA